MESMVEKAKEVTFEQSTELEVESPTLIEGLPGLGLVASIAVEEITRQLELGHHGNLRSETFPPVASFEDGRFRDTVRVYAGSEPGVMTLQSDINLPPHSFRPLSQCVIEDLANEFGQAVFLAGAPAENEDEVGDVSAAATTDATEDELTKAGVELAEGSGILSGVTGALIDECYRSGIPAAVLIVKSNPYIPDPKAARSLVENGIEPLLEFDIDTSELKQQAEKIQGRKEQIAQQIRQQQQEGQESPTTGMYQ